MDKRDLPCYDTKVWNGGSYTIDKYPSSSKHLLEKELKKKYRTAKVEVKRSTIYNTFGDFLNDVTGRRYD